jgi:hypothetical protein
MEVWPVNAASVKKWKKVVQREQERKEERTLSSIVTV